MVLRSYGDIGDQTCGGFIGFNISATPDPVADGKLAADAETMMGWGMDSLKVDGCAKNNTAAALVMNVTYPKLGAALKAAAAKAGRPDPWYSCSWPDYVGDILCDHKRCAPESRHSDFSAAAMRPWLCNGG